MAYQVLARKWRPRHFGEVVGQEHVLRALINALDNNRLHHAYLFTGTRGVGKTTLGRILAKSLNCEHGVSSTPCGQCSACLEIDEGRFVDLLEVDAASRTKVEDTRELLENVQYAPTRGRYKVYLIDEVHMLSNHSFNALLKTLEEPPPHVKFLLATTDPQKLPVTILSRCLKFNLKFIPVDRIQSHLQYVLEQENTPCESSALLQIARSAAGSMRDALSLLDQAIAHGRGEVRDEEVRAMLGTLNREEVFGLMQALAAQDGAGLLEEVHRLAQFGVDFSVILSELMSLMHQIALTQIAGVQHEEHGEVIAALASAISPEDTQLYYQIAVQGMKDLPQIDDSRAGFEMIMLRMLAFRPTGVVEEKPAVVAKSVTPVANSANTRASLKAALKQTPVENAALENIPPKRPSIENEKTHSARQHLKAALGGQDTVQQEDAAPTNIVDDAPPIGDSVYANDTATTRESPVVAADTTEKPQSWAEVVARLPLNGMARQVAANSVVLKREGSTLYLTIAPAYVQLASVAALQRLEEALSEFYGRRFQVRVEEGKAEQETPAQQHEREVSERKQDAVKRFGDDPAVQSMVKTFDAVLDPDSVQLTD